MSTETHHDCGYSETNCTQKHTLLVWVLGILIVLIGGSTTASTWAIKESMAATSKAAQVETQSLQQKTAADIQIGYLVKGIDELKLDIKAMRQTLDDVKAKVK